MIFPCARYSHKRNNRKCNVSHPIIHNFHNMFLSQKAERNGFKQRISSRYKMDKNVEENKQIKEDLKHFLINCARKDIQIVPNKNGILQLKIGWNTKKRNVFEKLAGKAEASVLKMKTILKTLKRNQRIFAIIPNQRYIPFELLFFKNVKKFH